MVAILIIMIKELNFLHMRSYEIRQVCHRLQMGLID